MQFIWTIKKIYKKLFRLNLNSEDYWVRRYDSGGDSGAGSHGKLAEFKAEIINDFVRKHNIETVIEFGCGDGNQLKLAEYPHYIGFDVSLKAIELCRGIFLLHKSKSFWLIGEHDYETAHLTLSLDVIYHLLEDEVYYTHMERLFSSSEKFVIIYSSDYEEELDAYIKRRKFTDWIDRNKPEWKLRQHIPNKYPRDSRSSFYIYRRDRR